MNNLLDNPVSNLSSLPFLLFYGLVCIATLFVARWYVGKADGSTLAGDEPLPTSFDPFEIAYLRGGANELVRYAVFDLTRNGLLELTPPEKKKEPRILRTATAPNPAALHPACAIVYAFFDQPHTAEELFKSNVPKDVNAAYDAERARLEQRQLLSTQAARDASRTARLVGFFVIAGVGGFRIAQALSLGHRNVGFTIVIMIAGVILLFPMTGVRRLTKRGLRFVAKLRAALGGDVAAPPSPASAAFPIMVAAGGLALLAATPYDPLNQTFGKQAPANGTTSSSCSGGCGNSNCSSGDGGGSSCGGGGGCGGGCGG